MQTLAVSKGLKVPYPLHDSWANAKSCRDISRLFKDYSLFYVTTRAPWWAISISMNLWTVHP